MQEDHTGSVEVFLTYYFCFMFRRFSGSITLYLNNTPPQNSGEKRHLKNKLISPFDAFQVRLLNAALYGLKQPSTDSLKSSKSIKQALSCECFHGSLHFRDSLRTGDLRISSPHPKIPHKPETQVHNTSRFHRFLV